MIKKFAAMLMVLSLCALPLSFAGCEKPKPAEPTTPAEPEEGTEEGAEEGTEEVVEEEVVEETPEE